MANTIKWQVDTTTKVTIFPGTSTQHANDIANMVTDAAALSAAVENTDGSQYAMFELRVKPQAAVASGYFNIWLIRSLNGTDFEDATGHSVATSIVVPARPADVMIPVRAVTTQQVAVSPPFMIPPQDFKVFIESKLTTTTSNSTSNENELFVLTFNDEVQ
jgi:hypothetical protein